MKTKRAAQKPEINILVTEETKPTEDMIRQANNSMDALAALIAKDLYQSRMQIHREITHELLPTDQ